jgi:CheY-like chemotaxis protein
MATGGVATVLVVDDQQSLRTYMARVLDSEGYAVIEAGSGVEALSLLGRKDEGVVVDLAAGALCIRQPHAVGCLRTAAQKTVYAGRSERTGP